MASGKTNLQASLAAEVRPACTHAFNRLFKEVEALSCASIQTSGTFYASSNKALPDSQAAGRLIIGFGSPAGRGVTNYTFRFPDLSANGKSARTRSMRYRADGSKNPNGAPRGAVEVFRSVPSDGPDGVEESKPEAGAIMAETAHTANAMSFGCLFTDPLGGLAPLADRTAIMDGSAVFAEADAYRRCAGSFVAGLARCGMEQDPGKRVAAVKALYDSYSGVLDGGSAGPMDGSSAIDRQAAWHVLADREAVVESFRGDPRAAKACEFASAAMSMADAVPGVPPDEDDLAWRGMGLGRLLSALKAGDAAALGAGGDGRVVNFSNLLAEHGASEGLMYLSAYKECRDHGGAAGKLPDGSDGPTGILESGTNIYHKLCSTRAKAELRASAIRQAAPQQGACYLKTRGGMTSGESDARCEAYMSYRFLRHLALGDPLDGMSSAPVWSMGFAPVENTSKKSGASPISVTQVLPDGRRSVRLLSDLVHDAQAGGSSLDLLPSLAEAARNGQAENIGKWARELCKKSGGTTDILDLEIKSFTVLRGSVGPLSKYDARLRIMESDYIRAQEEPPGSGDGRPKAPQVYTYMREHAAGYPSARYGSCRFGSGIMAEIEASGAGSLREALARNGITNQVPRTRPGQTAASFRKMDMDRDAVVSFLGISPDGSTEWPQALSEAGRGFYHDYNGALDRWGQVMLHSSAPSEAKMSAAWRQNDFMVLTDCYGLWGGDVLRGLQSNVDDMHGGKEPDGLYRPQNKAEADAIRTAYGYKGAAHNLGIQPSVIPFGLQGTTEGLMATLSPALEACPDIYPDIVLPFLDMSLDEGTKASDPARDALEALSAVRPHAQHTVSEVREATSAAVTDAVRRMNEKVAITFPDDGGGSGSGRSVPGE